MILSIAIISVKWSIWWPRRSLASLYGRTLSDLGMSNHQPSVVRVLAGNVQLLIVNRSRVQVQWCMSDWEYPTINCRSFDCLYSLMHETEWLEYPTIDCRLAFECMRMQLDSRPFSVWVHMLLDGEWLESLTIDQWVTFWAFRSQI